MTKLDIKVDTKRHRGTQNLEKSSLSEFSKTANEKRRKLIKTLSTGFTVVSAFLIILGVWGYYKLYVPGMLLKQQAYLMLDEVKTAKVHFDNQDLVSLQDQIPVIESELGKFTSQYEYFSFARKLPIAKGYYANGENLLEAVRLSLPLSQNLLTASTPIADAFGFSTTDGDHEELKGQEKIETIIRNLPDITSILDESELQINQILGSLNKIDPAYLPKTLGGIEIQERFFEIEELLSDSKEIFSDVRDLLTLVPEIAGAGGKRTYLLLFQNNMEIRPTGGFITASGYAEVENGVLGDIESEDIYNLDQRIRYWEKAPKEIEEYLGQYEWHIRDVNIYADLVSSSEKFKEMYDKQPAPRHYDGIIYIDTHFVELLMDVVGEIHMRKYNELITADNIVYQLELYSEKILTGGPDRKQFLEDLMKALVERLVEAERDQWGCLIDSVWEALNGKSLQLYFIDEDVQSLAAKYGFTGEIREDIDGDYIYVVESNMGGLKANMYVTSEMTQDVKIDEEGNVIKNVKIRWENPEPKDFWLNGPYRNWLRIYIPQGSELLGGGLNVREMNESWNERDYGRTVLESFITVPVATGCTHLDKNPECDPGVFELEFSYKLPFKVEKEESYNLFIQKQPGKKAEPQTIYYNGETFEYVLDRDLELML